MINIWIKNSFFKKFNLSIYGEISNFKYFNLIKKKILDSNNIKYHGALNKNKIKILSKYDVFIFPSKSENFGLVILEAIAAGLYIILDKRLPWKNIALDGLASLINFNSYSLENAVRKLSKRKNKIRSLDYFKKTQFYLHKNYNWKNISDLYFSNYKKLL